MLPHIQKVMEIVRKILDGDATIFEEAQRFARSLPAARHSPKS